MEYDKLTLKQLRKLNDLTQADVAKKLGVHVCTYRKIEENPKKASIEFGEVLANLYGVEFSKIFLTPNLFKIESI